MRSMTAYTLHKSQFRNARLDTLQDSGSARLRTVAVVRVGFHKNLVCAVVWSWLGIS
jgi:hypothetical protein